MTLVTCVRVVDRHRPPIGPSYIRLSYIDILLHVAVGMRIMAIGALDPLKIVD